MLVDERMQARDTCAAFRKPQRNVLCFNEGEHRCCNMDLVSVLNSWTSLCWADLQTNVNKIDTEIFLGFLR